MKQFLYSFFALFLLAGAVLAYGIFEWYPAQKGALEKDATLIIEKGMSSYQIAQLLAEKKIVPYKYAFWIHYQIEKRRHPGLALQAGQYTFYPGTSVARALQMVSNGEVTYYKVSIPDGFSNHAVFERLKNTRKLSGALPPMPAEGQLQPDTYYYMQGDSRAELVARMQKRREEVLHRLWETRAIHYPFLDTPEKALILASIVEKETGWKDERARVAGVFITRLKKGMKLQSDPTTIYAVTKGKGRLGRAIRKSDLRAASPFNTYHIYGLTPTPICNPGTRAIEAVLNPNETGDLFFVANGKGGHWFAKTLAGHNKNVKKWRAIEKKRRR